MESSPGIATKHNYLVRSIEDLPRVLHEAFYVAQHGRPGPVVIDIPKDVQFARGEYFGPKNVEHKTYHPRLEGDPAKIEEAVSLMAAAKTADLLNRRRRHQFGAGSLAAAARSRRRDRISRDLDPDGPRRFPGA